MKRDILFPIVLCMGLAACGGEQFSDLKQFVKDSDNLPHGRIAPLPEVNPYEPFTYDAYNLVDPFKPRSMMNEISQEFGERADIVVIPESSRAPEPVAVLPPPTSTADRTAR